MSVWISALKEYNAKKGMWCMPKKGTAEHAEVMKIMDKMKGGKAKPETKPEPKRKLRTEKEKKESEMMAKEDRDAPAVKTLKRRKAKAESESDSDVPVAKPKARAESPKVEKKVKAPKMVYKGEKFNPVMRTAKEKEEHAEKMELEMMAEDFKAGSPLKKKTSGKK